MCLAITLLARGIFLLDHVVYSHSCTEFSVLSGDKKALGHLIGSFASNIYISGCSDRKALLGISKRPINLEFEVGSDVAFMLSGIRLITLYVCYFTLFIVSCGTGDVDRRACLFICIYCAQLGERLPHDPHDPHRALGLSTIYTLIDVEQHILPSHALDPVSSRNIGVL